MKSRIVLIGNGFDLELGLKTRYKDFFEWQQKFLFKDSTITMNFNKDDFLKCLEPCWKENVTNYPYLNFDNIDEKVLLTSKDKYNQNFQYITIWDVFLISKISKESPCWIDIEETIYESFKIHFFGKFFWKNVISIINDVLKRKNILCSFDSFCNSINNNFNSDEKYIAYFLLKYRPLNSNKFTNDSNQDKYDILLDFLKKEMLFFEYKFCRFILDTLEYKPAFSSFFHTNKTDNAYSLLNRMMKFDIRGNQEPLYLISFNYTYYESLIIGLDDDRGKKIVESCPYCVYIPKSYMLHLHGCCSDMNIIFGIDDHTFKNEKEEMWNLSFNFTKSFRLSNIKQRQMLRKFVLPQKENEIEIYFYGLSLGKNDYSYYQSLFDRYDLYYNSKIKLIFVTNLTHEYELKRSVYKLIQEYGKTLDNKDHGKNLMTLLQLEGRLEYHILDPSKNTF